MFALMLSVILALVLGGCVCVVWAERGGPRWARGVANVTLAAGQLVRGARKTQSRNGITGNRTDTGDSDAT